MSELIFAPVNATAGSNVTTELSFVFASSGFLLFYYLGVMAKLYELKLVDPRRTKFGGVSGGAITAALTCAGYTPLEVKDMFSKRVVSYCRANPDENCNQKLSDLIKTSIYDRAFDEKAYERCGKGQISIALTTLDPYAETFDRKGSEWVSEFTSAEDMKQAILGSGYISCQSGPHTYLTFRNQPVLDGGYAGDYADFCSSDSGGEGGRKKCIKVSCFVVGENDTKDAPEPTTRCFVKPPMLSSPPPNATSSWTLPTDCATYYYNTFHTSAVRPEIYPGKFSQIKYSKMQWIRFGFCFPGEEEEEELYQQGLRDAQSWYDQEGKFL